MNMGCFPCIMGYFTVSGLLCVCKGLSQRNRQTGLGLLSALLETRVVSSVYSCLKRLEKDSRRSELLRGDPKTKESPTRRAPYLEAHGWLLVGF